MSNFSFKKNLTHHYDKNSKTNNTSLFNLNQKFEKNEKENLKVSNLNNPNLYEVKNKNKDSSLKEQSSSNDSKNILKTEKKTLNISDIDIGNPVLQKYFEETKKQGKCKGQKYQISFLDYILPFSCLKKCSDYNLLILYTNVFENFLSLEHYLPMIEGFNRMYYREGDEYRNKFKGALFRLQNYDEY